jgi:hydrogenase maturation protease
VALSTRSRSRRPTAAAARLGRLLTEVGARGQRLLLLGVGNPMLGDDGVGVRIAEDVAALGSEAFAAVPVGIALENAAHLVGRHRADVVVLVDAALGVRGSWGFLPPARLDTLVHSTHSVPLPVFVQLWQRENPELAVHFLGVAPVQNDLGSGLTPAVEEARREIVAAFAAAARGD